LVVTDSKKDNRNGTSESILQIADNLVTQIDKTRKLLVIMIIAIIVAIPISWHVSPILLGSPYNFRLAGIVTVVLGIAFLAVGARQWLILSDWTGKYKAYKELQKEIDARLDFEGYNQKDNE
jgi:H+/gluconate symporter-like permease